MAALFIRHTMFKAQSAAAFSLLLLTAKFHLSFASPKILISEPFFMLDYLLKAVLHVDSLC